MQRSPRSSIGSLSTVEKKLWGKIDRSKLTNPIYAPTPRYLGKQAEVEMDGEEELLVHQGEEDVAAIEEKKEQ